MIGGLRDRLGDAVDHGRNHAHDLLMGVEDEADDIGLAGAQANAGAVRPVADLAGEKLDAPAGFLSDFRPVLQRSRDRRDGEARQVGERFQGRALVAIERWAIRRRGTGHLAFSWFERQLGVKNPRKSTLAEAIRNDKRF